MTDLATTHVHLTEVADGRGTLFTDRQGDSAYAFAVFPRACNGVAHDVLAVLGPLLAPRPSSSCLLYPSTALAALSAHSGLRAAGVGGGGRELKLVAALLDMPGRRVWLPRAGWVPFARWIPELRPWAPTSRDRVRAFVASDDQRYSWRRCRTTREWTCSNDRRYFVASYYADPDADDATLTIAPSFHHLAPQIIASFLVVRYLAERRSPSF